MNEDHPSFQKQPFERKYDIEDNKNPNKSRDIFSISVNPEERAMINELKDWLQIEGDSTTLKIALKAGHNVLHMLFGKELLKYISSPRRLRPGPG